MVRRRSRSRRRRPQTGVQLIQILGLGVILLIILLFRDEVGEGAGKVFGAMGSDDVQVTLEDAGTSTGSARGVETKKDAGVN